MAPVELNASLEVVLDLRAELGEGPIWDYDTHSLIFVDSTAGRIHQLFSATGVLSQIGLGCEIGAAIPRESGGFVVSSVDGLLSVACDGLTTLLVAVERDFTNHRMNDAKCDSRRRLFSGTFAVDGRKGAGSLYRIDPDLSLTRLLDSVSVSNGLAWSPDEKLLYYVDTRTRGVDCFDYDIETGTLASRRRFVDIARSDGLPDGLTVDAEGHVWVALYRGGKVHRYAPDGSLVAVITLPVSGVTSCTFGGADLSELYITTARFGVAAERLAHEPLAGALFRCLPGVAGLTSYRFA